ncbi:hypothetical protein Q4511_11610 [Paracoccus sp. 1_MG-2023]|uniref:hypothetical protein n=1 Tax=unclassified Paracoccus (in: a-proteobacteria) TaxID=2688777 RepID=UPI001C098C07|nr:MULTISPECIES: hypothetical protein [unclassified Paracoccus (in: a-proteobacteria)]MBU2957097.1 hypothetical protein [Paracoccus sp. C2R09]MDO6669569.1 hypothetical protein [Paracoccus sp. 1_MG-2023]
MFRPLPILLAIAIALTSVGIGAARGTIGSGGQIVLCTGNGVVTVPDGRGGGDVHLCPDMALAFLQAPLPADAGLPARAGLPRSIHWPDTAQAMRPAGDVSFRARDPPGGFPRTTTET